MMGRTTIIMMEKMMSFYSLIFELPTFRSLRNLGKEKCV